MSVVWTIGKVSVVSADEPGAVCVLQITAKNKVLSILVDQPQNFNIAIPTPTLKAVNIPIQCDRLSTLAAGVANQNNKSVSVTIQAFSNDGTLICTKGPIAVAENGSQGFTFADCQ
jgi:hypothetical protein